MHKKTGEESLSAITIRTIYTKMNPAKRKYTYLRRKQACVGCHERKQKCIADNGTCKNCRRRGIDCIRRNCIHVVHQGGRRVEISQLTTEGEEMLTPTSAPSVGLHETTVPSSNWQNVLQWQREFGNLQNTSSFVPGRLLRNPRLANYHDGTHPGMQSPYFTQSPTQNLSLPLGSEPYRFDESMNNYSGGEMQNLGVYIHPSAPSNITIDGEGSMMSEEYVPGFAVNSMREMEQSNQLQWVNSRPSDPYTIQYQINGTSISPPLSAYNYQSISTPSLENGSYMGGTNWMHTSDGDPSLWAPQCSLSESVDQLYQI